MEKARILLVDDEQAFANNLSKLLSKRGYGVAAVHDGQSAVNAVEEGEFDVVILDLKMPGMDGIEALKIIKRRKPLVEVIILTGEGSIETGLEGMQYGAFDYALKPIQIDELQEKIGQAHQRKMIHESALETRKDA
jgi:two-component system, OmpR family, response regulator